MSIVVVVVLDWAWKSIQIAYNVRWNNLKHTINLRQLAIENCLCVKSIELLAMHVIHDISSMTMTIDLKSEWHIRIKMNRINVLDFLENKSA